MMFTRVIEIILNFERRIGDEKYAGQEVERHLVEDEFVCRFIPHLFATKYFQDKAVHDCTNKSHQNDKRLRYDGDCSHIRLIQNF